MISTRCEFRQTETSTLFTPQEILAKAALLRPELNQDDIDIWLKAFGYNGSIQDFDIHSFPEVAYNTAVLAHVISAKGQESEMVDRESALRKLFIRVNGAEIAEVSDQYVIASTNLNTPPEHLEALYSQVNTLHLVQQMMLATNNRMTYFPPVLPRP